MPRIPHHAIGKADHLVTGCAADMRADHDIRQAPQFRIRRRRLRRGHVKQRGEIGPRFEHCDHIGFDHLRAAAGIDEWWRRSRMLGEQLLSRMCVDSDRNVMLTIYALAKDVFE